MRQLYFLRHGLADRAAYEGSDDRLRPLTPEGRERLAVQAANLRRMGWRPDLLLSSPLTRALQTAEIVAGGLDQEIPVQVEESLACGFNLRELKGLLDRYSSTRQLVLVGHEPDFSEMISFLTGGSALVIKKASLARVDLFHEDPPAGELVWLIPPKALAI